MTMTIEKYCTIQDLAKLLHLSLQRTRLLIKDEPGVLKIESNTPTGKRRRLMYRIPESVVERILRRNANPPPPKSEPRAPDSAEWRPPSLV